MIPNSYNQMKVPIIYTRIVQVPDDILSFSQFLNQQNTQTLTNLAA